MNNVFIERFDYLMNLANLGVELDYQN